MGRLLLLFLLFPLSPTFGQSDGKDSTERKRWPLTFSADIGRQATMGGKRGSLREFQEIAPQSELLDEDLSGYQHKKNELFFKGIGTMLSVRAGFSFLDEAPDLRLRIGFQGLWETNSRGSLSDTLLHSSRTLKFEENGRKYVQDSIHIRTYRMTRKSQHYRLAASLILRMAPGPYWSFYGGAGITAGMSVSRSMKVVQRDTVKTRVQNEEDGAFFPKKGGSDGIVQERKETLLMGKRPRFFGSVLLPFGAELQVWRSTRIFLEFRPAFHFVLGEKGGPTSEARLTPQLGIKLNLE